MSEALPPAAVAVRSGPRIAAMFHRLLGAVFLVAWVSLGLQVSVLIGPRGLLPLGAFLDEAARSGGLPPWAYPSLLRWPFLTGDFALVAGCALGLGLSLAAVLGFRPRLCLGCSTFLYLGYVAACRTFLAFQWDNMLIECGFLAVFLSAQRPAAITHFLFRVLLFKLYFESGIAKWQSPLHDWHDGSAMTFYYETAPLPTSLAWHAQNLPAAWHHFESRATLFLELVVPFAIFGPRKARLAAAVLFSGFQLVDIATANYGFFCYLALVLNVFLLDERDIPARLQRWLSPRAVSDSAPARKGCLFAAAAGAGIYVVISLIEAGVHFTDGGTWIGTVSPLRRIYEPLRMVNTYHLFAAITRERVEPEFQTSMGGDLWQPHHLYFKPGPLDRAPPFVAPHQPRVDFQLWFYGLGFARREPAYVTALRRAMCRDPAAVQTLFAGVLPPAPSAVRIAYYQYNFTSPAERRTTGHIWRRTLAAASGAFPCR